MTDPTNIRPFEPADLPALEALIDAVELFPSELLDGMIGSEPGGDDTSADDEPAAFWRVYAEPAPLAVLYCAPEPMTSGTWNALLLAVHPGRHGEGIGTDLMRHAERIVAARGARLLLVETSGKEAFARTRGFYRRIGYEEVARVADYYDVGDDKRVFRKAL